MQKLNQMKNNYLISNQSKSNMFSIKKSLLTLVALLFMSVAFAQSEINITTTYNNASLDWTMLISTPGTPPDWTATGPGGPFTPQSSTNNPSAPGGRTCASGVK